MNKRGFTLMELLVVIAVLALLVSMLMPSLWHARQLARSAVCASNLRHSATIWQLYAQDYGGKWPAPWNVHPSRPDLFEYSFRFQWPYLMGYFYNRSAALPAGFPHNWAVLQQNNGAVLQQMVDNLSIERSGLLFCPSLVQAGIGNAAWEGRLTYSYAIMAKDPHPYWREPGRSPYQVGGFPDLHRMARPAEIFHLADFAGAADGTPTGPWFAYAGPRTAPHMGTSNYLHCDGHVERLPQDGEHPHNFQSQGPP